MSISHRAAAIVAALILLFAAAGCAATPAVPTEPVVWLDCFVPQSAVSAAAIDGRTVAVASMDENFENTVLTVIDICDDTVTATDTFAGNMLMRRQSLDGGVFSLYDLEHGEWIFLDRQLTVVGRFSTDRYDGVFSRDRKNYYTLIDNRLCTTDTATGETSWVTLAYDLRFSDILSVDESGTLISLRAMPTPYADVGFAVVNAVTGKVEALQGQNALAYFGGKALWLLQYNEKAHAYAVTTATKNRCRRADCALFAGQTDIVAIGGCDGYLLSIGDGTVIYRIGDTVDTCSLADIGVGGLLWDTCYVPEEQGFLCAATDDDGHCRLCIVHPAALPYTERGKTETVTSPVTVDEAYCDVYWGDTVGTPTGVTMEELRQYADKIEKCYGVSVLFGDECRPIADACDYTVETFQEGEGLNAMRECLECIDRNLKLYPDGFFRQFGRLSGQEGLRIGLAASISADYGSLDGFSMLWGGWHNILINATTQAFGAPTICHEIWHATENAVCGADHTAFDDDLWAALNPEGFLYYGEYGAIDDPEQGEYTLLGGDNDPYFIDSYRRTNAHEDRARLMEYVMIRENYAEQIQSSPALMAKLRYISERIRGVFDTDGWGVTRWERLFG